MADMERNFNLYNLRCAYHEALLAVLAGGKTVSPQTHQAAHKIIRDAFLQTVDELAESTLDEARSRHLLFVKVVTMPDSKTKCDYVPDQDVYKGAEEKIIKIIRNKGALAITAG